MTELGVLKKKRTPEKADCAATSLNWLKRAGNKKEKKY